MNYAGPLSSQPPPLLHFPLQASPLALLSSHSPSQQPYPTGQRGLLITAVISLLATLHSPLSLSLSLTLALSVSLCFIGMTNNATFVYPKQPQVGYTAQSNIKEQWKIKKETSMKYTCNNKIRKKLTFVHCQKTITFYNLHLLFMSQTL